MDTKKSDNRHLILYGGRRETVEKQLSCEHEWHGPCMDKLSRFFKCTKCFCLERDMPDNRESELQAFSCDTKNLSQDFM